MPKFGSKSRERLATCDDRLQAIANEVIKHVDCTVLCGHRNEEDQNAAVAKGNPPPKPLPPPVNAFIA